MNKPFTSKYAEYSGGSWTGSRVISSVQLKIVDDTDVWNGSDVINDDEKQEIKKLSEYGSYNNPHHRFLSSGRIFNVRIEHIHTEKNVFSICIRSKDVSEIDSLPISYESKDKIFRWIRNVLFSAPYERIILDVSNDGDVIRSRDIVWDTPDEYSTNIKKYYEYKMEGKLSKYYGKWGVFDGDSVKIYNTFPSEDDQQGGKNAYIGMIGQENSPDLMDSRSPDIGGFIPLPVSNPLIERPPIIFNRLETTFYTSHRWIGVPVQVRGREDWIEEYFLIDTGAPSSYLVNPDLYKNVSERHCMYRMSILGIKVPFRKSSTSDNQNIHKINLLGASFINKVCLIDDYASGRLSMIPRFNVNDHQDITS